MRHFLWFSNKSKNGPWREIYLRQLAEEVVKENSIFGHKKVAIYWSSPLFNAKSLINFPMVNSLSFFPAKKSKKNSYYFAQKIKTISIQFFCAVCPYFFIISHIFFGRNIVVLFSAGKAPAYSSRMHFEVKTGAWKSCLNIGHKKLEEELTTGGRTLSYFL